jgi:hypothetical protein
MPLLSLPYFISREVKRMTSFTSNSSSQSKEEDVLQKVIHNQDRARARKRPKKVYNLGLVGLLVILACLEITVFRNVMFYGYSPGFVGQMAELRVSFQHAEAEDIQVGIFGDSMSMDALRPDLIEAAAGLPEGSVFNFSLSGGSAFDIAKTYEQYIDELPQMKQAIVVVNEHQFNDHLMFSDTGQVEDVKFRYFANASDRIAVMNSENYGDLTVGWMLKSYDLRSVWVMMLEKYQTGKLREEIPVYAGGLPAVTYTPPDSKSEAYAKDVADRWFKSYSVDGIRGAYFEKMISDMHERGIEVTLLQLPRTDFFEDVVHSEYPLAKQMYENKLMQLSSQYNMEWVKLSNNELTLEHFRDSNHVNSKGAERVSSSISKWVLGPKD